MLIPTRILTSRLRQWRTAHGFGVHSPFAYYFITRVLRERLPYYDFDLLPQISGGLIQRRQARMLYRLAAFFRPDTVYVAGRQSEAALAIVTLAHPSARTAATPQQAQMAIYAGADGITAAREVTVALGPDTSAVDALKASLPGGMTFVNSKTAVAVIRHGLPRQDFRLKF